MRKLILSLVLLSCVTAYADKAVIHEYKDYRYHYRHYGKIPNSAYFDPGSREAPGLYVTPRTGIDNPPIYTMPDDAPPPGFRYVQILDEQCNCYKVVLIPNL
jgi:hypothetical protein